MKIQTLKLADLKPAGFVFDIISPYLNNFSIDMNSSGVKPCWLCGDSATRWLLLREGISKTFCLPEQSRSPNSDIICLPCHAMSSKKFFDTYAAARLEMGLKPGYATSWRNYSHVAFKGHHSCPNRSEWGKWLLNPPEPPFLFVMAVSSQKHLIYKSKISTSREKFFIQMEDISITVEKSSFEKCFSSVRKLLSLGFFKKHIIKNSYPYKFVITCKPEWKKLNDELNFFRKFHALWIDLACFCAVTPEKKEK